ncbi:efflux RND transporter periplasmic adaptor subunit [Silanimonas sp.]|uniref:efflux RND transporter periplasmic adaptor subunit n=1 Tax=Silanimonas sp. TaxID=1929290 RepID=UPI001BB8F755|nr:efflux RND transporter periplasmic adaptor subunit [Silanimonas sp.]MBS3896570.1 efflux RND transporter periplasmic adaptor subunit [Silanimonas sp.]
MTTAEVATAPWIDRLEAVGTARASESIAITSKLAERVERVRFESGQRVEAGQVLVELDVGGDVADLDAARTAYREAQRQYERQRQLAEQRLIPTSQLDAQRATRDAAQARVQQALARVADRAIIAPFAGVLGLREVSPGQLLQPGTAITTLDALDTMQVDFAVPEVHLARLAEGLAVEARSDAWSGQVFRGRLISIDSRVDVATRSVAVRAAVENPEGRLLPGMLLTLKVFEQERLALVVPEIAVLQIGTQSYVYRVDAERRAELVPVRLGSRELGRVEVVEGLTAGDRIVIDGTVKLRPGLAIRESETAPSAGSAPTPAAGD